jgi:hypothetical protein
VRRSHARRTRRIAGVSLWPEYIADFRLAFGFGIAFQYFAITAMRRLSVHDGVIAALKSDTLWVITFEIGLFGWMALMFFVFFPTLISSRTKPRTGF